MNSLKTVCFFLIFSCSATLLRGQYKVLPAEGYTPQIGIMVHMLEDLKNRITEQVQDLSQEETDFLIDEKGNSIGAMIMHLAATESYYLVETLEERTWSAEEMEYWMVGASLGEQSREKFKGKPIQYYLDIWDEVRTKSLEGLKTRDDAWFASELDENFNIHFVWYHVMEHSANHMGQIALVKNRLPK